MHLSLVAALFTSLMVVCASCKPIQLTVRSQVMQNTGRIRWSPQEKTVTWEGTETAFIIVDMWNKHWCPSTTERESTHPSMASWCVSGSQQSYGFFFLSKGYWDSNADESNNCCSKRLWNVGYSCPIRLSGILCQPSLQVHYSHIPSRQRDLQHCFYNPKDRQWVLKLPNIQIPQPIPHSVPAFPIDASDNGTQRILRADTTCEEDHSWYQFCLHIMGDVGWGGE